MLSYNRLQIMIINGLLDAPISSNLSYVYKLTFTPTGHFYIGKTNDLNRRIITHTDAIKKFNDLDVTLPDSESFYWLLYSEIKKIQEKKPREKFEKLLRELLPVFIVAIAEDDTVACLIERHYIDANKGNVLFLNKK